MLCMLVVFSSVMPVAAASASAYPAGVTEKQALAAIDGTDALIANIIPALTGSDIKALIRSSLYTSESLSNILISTYSSMEESADALKLFGLDASPKKLSAALGAYPKVCVALYKYDSWADVNLDGISWGIKGKEDFAYALGAIFSPFNNLLYSLLCGGNYKMNKLITIKGDKGYENAIIPLFVSLKIKNYKDQYSFVDEAKEDKKTMVANIVLPVLNWLEEVTVNPMNELTDTLPGFAYYVDSGEFNENFKKLLKPITSNPLVEIATFLKIFDLDSLNLDVNTIIASFTENGDIKLAPVDFSTLSKCGTKTKSGYKSDKGRAYVEILRWLIESLKLNGAGVGKLLGENTDTSIIKGLLDTDTDALVATVILLFSPGKVSGAQAMVYPEFKKGSVQYTPNLKEKDLKRVYNEIDDLLSQIVREGGKYNSIEAMLTTEIYSNANINALLKGIYGAMEESGLLPLLNLMGADCSPKGVASHLKESKYSSAKAVLSKADSWSKVSFKNVKWGFGNGSRNGFQNALTAVLRPLFPVLRLLLAEQDMILLDSIYINGADGYNTAVIPILEALGCKATGIKTYKSYKLSVGGDGVVKNILNPVFDMIDDICKKPVKTLVEILPNAVYFMESGSLEKCISNLLLPVTSLFDRVPNGVKLPVDITSLTKDMNLEGIMESLLKDSGMKFAEFDIKDLASLGEAKEKTSKATLNGKKVKYTYIEADAPAMVMALLRIIAKTMKIPGNENLLMGSMGGSNMSFDVSAITKELENMNEDEFIEWLVNLFFKERVSFQVDAEEEYSPTIIFKQEEKDYTKLYIFLGYLGVCAVVGAIIFFNRKRLYGDNIC